MPDQVEKLKRTFGLTRVVLVGDRGMLTEKQIDAVKTHPGLGWISALRSRAIRDLVEGGSIQMSLFDQGLGEFSSPDYPGERLIACFNPLLCDERKRKREDLLAATEKELARIAREVRRRTKTPLDKREIGKKVGTVLNRFKVGKHFVLTIEEGTFSFMRNEETIRREKALDGIYVIRTSEPADRLSARDAVRNYKNLSQVEGVFKSMKGFDIRPIWHRIPDRVKAHIFLCMLAFYAEWHMRQALMPLLFDDEELRENRKTRHPVKPAAPSSSAQQKKAAKHTAEGLPIHSFRSLLQELGTLCRNTCRITSDSKALSFFKTTDPTPLQAKAFQLLGL